MTRILMVHADTAHEMNCSVWRCFIPTYGLRRIGVDVDEMWIDDWGRSPHDRELKRIVQAADAVFFQRNAFEHGLDALKFWRDLDKRILIDLDDAYQALPATVSAQRFWRDNARGFARNPLEQLREGLRLSSGLTSPSKLILEDWDAPTRVWLPNYVRAEWYAGLERKPHEGVVIGWGASMSHYDSIRYSGVVPALAALCKRDDWVRVAVCGNDREPYEMLRNAGVRPQQCYWQPGVPPHEWPVKLAQFDLGIAPLYGEYDRRRSWLKVVEYACAGVPCLVSDSDPYKELAGWCVAKVGNGPESWANALDTALSQLAEAQAVATKRRVAATLTFSIEANAGKWLKGLTGGEA